ncbi:hypothetical protein XAP6164_970021 [Xanthomonas phaseoli pv. phaseoli]|uniref:Transposase n=1 Tax=Xanthomonas campestris pv. phaseoli TaxID=317013 RepID=A0ABY1TSW0_XANCH|nr:hypothetical protein XAP6984_310022 [Xanthomonas phaseoli pv. phaseoli]SOO32475.1 hypothetical protein XAP6164_970021 [Xanthomonas phaseoli pv. phaseoli]
MSAGEGRGTAALESLRLLAELSSAVLQSLYAEMAATARSQACARLSKRSDASPRPQPRSQYQIVLH